MQELDLYALLDQQEVEIYPNDTLNRSKAEVTLGMSPSSTTSGCLHPSIPNEAASRAIIKACSGTLRDEPTSRWQSHITSTLPSTSRSASSDTTLLTLHGEPAIRGIDIASLLQEAQKEQHHLLHHLHTTRRVAWRLSKSQGSRCVRGPNRALPRACRWCLCGPITPGWMGDLEHLERGFRFTQHYTILSECWRNKFRLRTA